MYLEPLFSSSILAQETHFVMESLFRKIGTPLYSLNQILPLLDEASYLSSNPEQPTAQMYDAAVETVQSIEALARLWQFNPAEVFRFLYTPGPATDELAVLNSIRPKTLHLKGWLFDRFQLSQNPGSAHGTAKLCQYCNWPFRRISRGPYGLRATLSWSILEKSRYLLANDHWPDFPVLEERLLQGCEFCRFLCEHLLSLVVPQPGEFDGEPIDVWISFSWGDDVRTLEFVEVTLCGDSSCSGKSLYFIPIIVYSGIQVPYPCRYLYPFPSYILP